jgi:hypothetical protein
MENPPRNLTQQDAENLTALTNSVAVLDNAQLSVLSTTLRWGTYGPEGKRPLAVRYLADLDTDHLENILITQRQISVLYSKTIIFILKQRYLQLGVEWERFGNPNA